MNLQNSHSQKNVFSHSQKNVFTSIDTLGNDIIKKRWLTKIYN